MEALLYRSAGTDLEVGRGRTLHGLAVPYNSPTEIRDHTGTYREAFTMGSFERSIAERGNKVKLWIAHERRGRLPIGRPVELRETVQGLQCAFEIPDTQAGNDALTSVREGLANGFSVGFRPIRSISRDGIVVRMEAALFEVSLTADPAYSDALVAGVRSQADLEAEFENRKRAFRLLTE